MNPALTQALELVETGEHGKAKQILLPLLADPAALALDEERFFALRTLARCHRADREFGLARARAKEALELAQRVGSAAGVAIMLEGLALTEAEDGNLRIAGAYFLRSAEVEQSSGRLDGMAAALSNYAHMLLANGLDGGERLLERALGSTEPGSLSWALAADNMASELERQGRHAKAVEFGTLAVDAFRALGNDYHLFIALRNCARHLVDAGRIEEGVARFEEAHDLIYALRRAELDDAHYAGYEERVKAIEARTAAVLAEREGPDGLGVALMIGVHAHLGEETLQVGMRLIERGSYAEAIASLEQSRQHWSALEAAHCLVRVDYHLALAYVETGAARRALSLAYAVRARARELGDAYREQMALSLHVRMRNLMPTEDPLDYLAQESALRPAVARQLGLSLEAIEAGVADGGVTAMQTAVICADAYAWELAERYMRSSLAMARELPDEMAYRRMYRLANLYELLKRAGRSEQAAETLAEMRATASAGPPDPRVTRVLTTVSAASAFRQGDRSADTLDGLLAGCHAYEELRRRAGETELGGFAAVVDPPYEEAAEVALVLGRPALALLLLQRAKARTLLERLGIALRPLPSTSAEEDPPLPAIGDALGLELFVTSSGIGVFVLDGADGKITWTELDRVDEPTQDGDEPASLGLALRRLVDAGDDERSRESVDGILDQLLRHPRFQRIGAALTAAGEGRATWLAPHSFLHQAPLQLAAGDPERGTTSSWTIVPALSAVPALPTPRRRRPGHVVVVCGDPLGDLPFARAEARLVAGSHGQLAIGDECEARWVEERCASGDVGVLHLACHGRFDGRHPERSGLVLAAAGGGGFAGTNAAQLLAVDDVARLSLTGAVVALSACSSGLAVVREGDESTGLVSALLKAGAATVVAAHWRIPDLSAMLVMVDLHDRLAAGASHDVRALLGEAADRVRTMSAYELAARGLELAWRTRELGGDDAETIVVAAGCLGTALTATGDKEAVAVVADIAAPWSGESHGGEASAEAALEALGELRPSKSEGGAVRPFAHPLHWGAFVAIGQKTV